MDAEGSKKIRTHSLYTPLPILDSQAMLPLSKGAPCVNALRRNDPSGPGMLPSDIPDKGRAMSKGFSGMRCVPSSNLHLLLTSTSTLYPTTVSNVLHNITMQLLKTILLALPVAMAGTLPRGCGTAINKEGVGMGMIGDKQCQNLLFDLDRVIIGDGCYCVTFHGKDCNEGDKNNWQSWLLGYTTLDMGKTKKGSDSYRCSDDPTWGAMWDKKWAEAFPEVPKVDT
ncbi:hypothetical protein P153DRAFT_355518 [Dothidotthia symphoricarpi CBS 119687]|uniref:Uncharacterized protein n=1 Tax=Dothidotthia symphoricarpi CBS 119687 TaxID=1392245 RepID=A0A6A6AKZ2_9PLEO|nr:uncharacterized protein P153DRAFT_355518 [Dothidotthia symphoricarpi CBS 119687]KAF2131798.1 hypothetical protein P153DRAFT_355518 [Dothidotthia symphoricarpi CBS 119687]